MVFRQQLIPSHLNKVIDSNPTVRFKMAIIRSMLGFKIIKIGLKLSHRYCYLPNVIHPNPTVRFETIIAKLQLSLKLSGSYCKLG